MYLFYLFTVILTVEFDIKLDSIFNLFRGLTGYLTVPTIRY